jgi:hypothetical protein
VRLELALASAAWRVYSLMYAKRFDRAVAQLAAGAPQPRRFACLSLKGRYALGFGSDNAAVRRRGRRQGRPEE